MDKLKLSELFDKAMYFCIDVFIALLILFVGFKLIKLLENSMKKEHKFTKFDNTIKSFIISGISISLKIILFVIVATIVGIPTTTFVTLIGSCGITIGLALQGGLSNLAGGIMLLIFKPFKVGDYIECDSKEGTVKSITIFYTTLITPDNKEVQLPNGNISSNNITNYTAYKKRRVDLKFSVSYNSKIDKVKKIINEVIDNSEYVLKEEPRIIGLINHESSSLVFDVKVWTNTSNYFNAIYELEEKIKESFDKNKIEIPYSQLDVHLKK